MKKLTFLIPCFLVFVLLLGGCTPDKKPADKPTTEQNTFIGEEKAKDIALEKADLAASEVIFERTELDNENGTWLYEVEFRKGITEYSTDIKADDGTILSFETDHDN